MISRDTETGQVNTINTKMILLLLKTKAVFCIGFVIGVIFAVLLMLSEDVIPDKETCKSVKLLGLLNTGQCYTDNKSAFGRKVNDPQNSQEDQLHKNGYRSAYQKWLCQQNMHISRSNITLEYELEFESNIQKNEMPESMWLRTKIQVTCVVFVEKLRLAESIRGTWAPHCDKIYYFGDNKRHSEIEIVNFGIKFTSSWQFLCEAINYISTASSNATRFPEVRTESTMQWFIFVKDDMMVIPENLRYLVAALDSEKGYYLGHGITLWGQGYNVAQAGYVLSKGALLKINERFNTSEKCAAGGRFWKKEDYYLGKHLASLGIHPMDTRDENLSDTFHGYSLPIMLWGVARAGNYWTHALYPPGRHCCSSKSVTFSAGEPDKMYTLYYMLYRLSTYHSDEAVGRQPPSTDIPDQEVWKTILREEFNITDLDYVSSERYYEIWRGRYSDPEQFIINNYKNMPDVLSSMMTAYESEKKLDKTEAP